MNKKIKRCATAWIHKMLDSGLTQSQLLHNVGTFSNKLKSDVMKQKKLTSKQYERRNNFLFEVYSLLNENRY